MSRGFCRRQIGHASPEQSAFQRSSSFHVVNGGTLSGMISVYRCREPAFVLKIPGSKIMSVTGNNNNCDIMARLILVRGEQSHRFFRISGRQQEKCYEVTPSDRTTHRTIGSHMGSWTPHSEEFPRSLELKHQKQSVRCLALSEAFGVFAVGKTPGSELNEAMYTTAKPLVASADEPRFSSKGEKRVASRRWVRRFYDDDHQRPIPPPVQSK